jgi:hypothetical protein
LVRSPAGDAERLARAPRTLQIRLGRAWPGCGGGAGATRGGPGRRTGHRRSRCRPRWCTVRSGRAGSGCTRTPPRSPVQAAGGRFRSPTQNVPRVTGS